MSRAGEDWDSFVETDDAAGDGRGGVPGGDSGVRGGTPVQNVGAYGQEVAETIEWVRAFDRETRAFVELGKAECGFRYRREPVQYGRSGDVTL